MEKEKQVWVKVWTSPNSWNYNSMMPQAAKRLIEMAPDGHEMASLLDYDFIKFRINLWRKTNKIKSKSQSEKKDVNWLYAGVILIVISIILEQVLSPHILPAWELGLKKCKQILHLDTTQEQTLKP